MKGPFEFRDPGIGEFRLKVGDSARNFRKHCIDSRFDNLPVCGLATLKCEFDSRVRFHVHLRAATETIEGYPSEYCTIFYLGIVDSLNSYRRGHRDMKQGLSRVSRDTDSLNFSHLNDDLNKAMFIGVINISKKGQRSIPCFIGLQAFDSCPLSVTQSLDVLQSSIFFETAFSVTDGKENNPIERGVT